MATLTDITAKLKAATATPIAFKQIATRVLLQTGVNIIEPPSGADPAVALKVSAVLQKMGYRL